MDDSLLSLVRPEIRALNAYHVADSEGLLKLDAMENPYRLSSKLQQKLGEVLASAMINRYPDPDGGGLKTLLRQTFHIPTEASILLGNGSDEIITLLTQTLAKPGATVLAPEPSFVMYRMNALYSQMNYVGVPLNTDFSLDLSAMLAAIHEHKPALIFLAYPNNPTGNRFERTQVEAILDAASGLVVVDEAYQVFSDDSFMDQAGCRQNLLVMRTLSKVGLAGIRLGYAASTPGWINELNKVRPPYNVNVLTLAAARFALHHLPVFNEQAAILRSERERLTSALSRLPGVTVFPSEGNFVTVRVPDATAWFNGLRSQGILIKSLHGSHYLLENCLRFTVGSPEENAAVLTALDWYSK